MTEPSEGRAKQGPPPRAVARLSHEDRVQDGYYIYGLVDPRAFRETGGDALLSIFYVGKGRRSRWAVHESDVLNALRSEEVRPEQRSGKAERIRMILDRAERVPAVRLSAGYVDENDAYYAESLAIDTVGAALAAAGRPPLTNATPGHHAGFVWLGEHFVFTETTEQDLNETAAGGLSATEILVKGGAQDLIVPGQRLTDRDALPPELAALGDRVVPIQLLGEDHPETTFRRGWDPLDPWTDLEARERARRYWPIALGKVALWIRDPATMPGRLLLGIPERRGRTVVRYAWTIDRSAPWEFYPQWAKWGVPLGPRDRDHPKLGSALYETRNGRRVQVLLGFASGIRVLNT